MSTTNEDTASGSPGQMKFSFAFSWILSRYNINRSSSGNSKVRTQTKSIASSMRIERYYSSLREEHSPLSDDAYTLLDRQDYVGFFKTCGANYIRGIRRAQEVVTWFEFQSTSLSLTTEYSRHISHSSGGRQRRGGFFGRFRKPRITPRKTRTNSLNINTKFSSMQQSLSIVVKGYGLGLNHEGSDTLVVTSLDDYRQVMKTAFRIMTQSKDSYHIGMVYGMEVIPWVDNVAFQVAARFHDTVITIPLPRSLIAKAITIDRTDTQTIYTTSNRTLFTCRDPTAKIDKFGYCCDPPTLYNHATDEYDSEDPHERICKPSRVIDRSIVKTNVASNAEYVARLDIAVRSKLTRVLKLESCISATKSFPAIFDYHILKSQDTVKYDEAIEQSFTLAELKVAIDPFGDYTLVNQLSDELTEYMDMFYYPCLDALYGANIGTNSDTDPIYFMAYAWHTHEECTQLSCHSESMRWDRNEGGCVPGILSGEESAPYVDGEDKKCSYADKGGLTQECKYKQSDLKAYDEKLKKCWNNSAGVTTSIVYLMDHFCLPNLSLDVVDDTTKTNLINAISEDNCPSGGGSSR